VLRFASAVTYHRRERRGRGDETERGYGTDHRSGDRIDLLVEHRIIVALEAVAQLEPIHEAHLLSYLKLSRCHVGLLINFNVKLLRNDIRRLVNELKE
jgi:GxxExxY protein